MLKAEKIEFPKQAYDAINGECPACHATTTIVGNPQYRCLECGACLPNFEALIGDQRLRVIYHLKGVMGVKGV